MVNPLEYISITQENGGYTIRNRSRGSIDLFEDDLGRLGIPVDQIHAIDISDGLTLSIASGLPNLRSLKAGSIKLSRVGRSGREHPFERCNPVPFPSLETVEGSLFVNDSISFPALKRFINGMLQANADISMPALRRLEGRMRSAYIGGSFDSLVIIESGLTLRGPINAPNLVGIGRSLTFLSQYRPNEEELRLTLPKLRYIGMDIIGLPDTSNVVKQKRFPGIQTGLGQYSVEALVKQHLELESAQKAILDSADLDDELDESMTLDQRWSGLSL